MASRSAQVAPKHLLGLKRRGLACKGQPLGLPRQVLAQRPVDQEAGQAVHLGPVRYGGWPCDEDCGDAAMQQQVT